MVRLKDIAMELDVSVNTVSNALNGTGRMSSYNRARILTKAKEMGYIPNSTAKSLRGKKSNVIAVLYDNVINPYYSIMMALINRRLITAGYALMTFADYTINERIKYETTQRIVSSGADGLISFLEISDEECKLLKRRNLPTIILGRKAENPFLDSIISDDIQGAYDATVHLIKKGRKNLLFISLSELVSCCADRRAGFERAVKEYGVRGRVLTYTKQHRQLEQAIGELDISQFDGIFCFNDQIVFELLLYLEELDIPVPAKISVVGYDNIQSHLILPRRITSIEPSKEIVAEEAVKMLLNRIENKELTGGNHLVCPANLVEMKTT